MPDNSLDSGVIMICEFFLTDLASRYAPWMARHDVAVEQRPHDRWDINLSTVAYEYPLVSKKKSRGKKPRSLRH